MKLKKWLAASAAAMILVSGASAVSAASITTAGDQKLDLGSSISVLPGERTFFGGQFPDWLLTGNVEGTHPGKSSLRAMYFLKTPSTINNLPPLRPAS